MKKFTKKISICILTALCSLGLAGGLSACKEKGPVENPYSSTSYKVEAPTDGSLPTEHTALENLGYMASVLDSQPYYHSYAHNSSKAMGFEQITQSWKDYRSDTEIGKSVMICSDISYSSMVKYGAQTCFVGNSDAYMRSASKPSRDTNATNADWSLAEPTRYTHDQYLTVYGDFSTELTVYLINADTIATSSSVAKNNDGTYSLNVTLKPEAGANYQYGMATRGSLKGYPVFNKIDLTFTFDSSWRVLSTYCEEYAQIAPKALGGIPTDSVGKTTTTFSYGEEEFDNTHYSYFESYFKQYLGVSSSVEENNPASKPSNGNPEMLDVLGGGFGEVVNPNGNGQQFNVDLTLGNCDYTGKLYAKLGSLDDIIGTLDVRAQFSKRGSGKQDLYIQFKGGNIDVYYSNNFALTANLDSFKTITDGVSALIAKFATQKVSLSEIDTLSDSGLDLSALLSSINFTYNDTLATIALNSDDLLGLGVGISAELNFARKIDEDGSTFSFSGGSIDSVKLNGEKIDFLLAISPDAGSNIINREPADNPADLADYAASIFGLLNSNTVKFDISLDGDVCADAQAYLALGSEIAAKADISVSYKDLAVKLSAYYSVDIHAGDFGTVYLTLTEFNGNPLNAKLKCNVSEAVSAVSGLISSLSNTVSEQAVDGTANIVNKILNLNFSKIIGGLYADGNKICVSLDVDKILEAFSLDTGISFGKAALTLTNGEKAKLSLELPQINLSVNAEGSDTTITLPDGDGYVDAVQLIDIIMSAVHEGMAIKEAGAASFDINLACKEVSIAGSGEACWTDGLKIAIDATLSFGDSKMPVKLLYDKELVKLQINGVGIDIYSGTTESYAIEGNENALSGIFEIISVDDLINYVFAIVNELVFTIEQTPANTLVITYAAENKLAVCAEGGFALSAEIKGLNVTAHAKASDCSIIENFEIATQYSSLNSEDIMHFALDLFDTLQLKNILGGKTYAATVTLTGANSDIQILKDYNVNAEVTLSYSEEYEHNLLRADLIVSLNVIYDIYVQASISYYDNALYLHITNINGNAVSLKAKAEADDVYSAVLFMLNSAATLEDEATSEISTAISSLIGIDLESAVSYTAAEGLKVDVDSLLKQLDVQTFAIGEVTATADLSKREISASAALDNKVWLTLNASPAEVAPSAPQGNYIDIFDFAQLILNAKEQAEQIKEDKALSLELEDFVITTDGVSFNVGGKGEIDWENNLFLALDLTFSVSEGEKQDDLTVKLIYNGNAANDRPIVSLALNDAAFEIYASDIDEAKNTVSEIQTAIGKLLSKQSVQTQSEEGSFDFASILTNDNVQLILSKLLGIANKFNLNLGYEQSEVISLIINTAENGGLTLSSDGNLAIDLSFYNEHALIGFAANVSAVERAEGAKYFATAAGIESFIANDATVTTGETFIKAVYDYIFTVIEKLSIQQVLGGKTYEVALNLYGNNSGVAELAGVTVNGTLYYTEALEGTTITQGKLAEADLKLVVGNFNLDLNARYYAQSLYIQLKQIGTTALDGIKFVASAQDIYAVAQKIVEIISNENIGNLFGGVSTTAEEGEQSENPLTALINGLLTLDFNKAVEITSAEDGTSMVTADIDYVLKTLGVDISVGKAYATLNHTTHDLAVSLKNAAEEEYASFTAGKIERRSYEEGWQASYIDIGFAEKLIGDIYNTVTDENGNLYTLYTFSGHVDITADLRSFINLGELTIINIPVEILKLSAGLDENNQFYFSMVASLSDVSPLGISVTQARVISITYSNGYITLGRFVDTDAGEFKVMTLNYFLDNIFSKKDNSPLPWLLGISTSKNLLLGNNSIWGLIADNVSKSVKISSGLTTPGEYYLYDNVSQKADGSSFMLASILNSLAVKINGEEVNYSFATGSNDATKAPEKLTINDNYYAFDLNLNSLTGGTIKESYAALLREDDKGISGLKAYLDVAGILKVDLNLDNYLKGIPAEEAAPDYFAPLKDSIDFAQYDNAQEDPSTHTTTAFGCYDSTGSYDPSNVLSIVKFNVVSTEATKSVVENTTLQVRYGSKVHFSNSFNPVWVGDKKLVFSFASDRYLASIDGATIEDLGFGSVGIASLTQELTVYALVQEASSVTVHMLKPDGTPVIENAYGEVTVNAAFASGEALPEYKVEGFAFLGWYSDAVMETPITTFNGESAIYGQYIVEKQVIEGVTYTYVNGEYKITAADATYFANHGYTTPKAEGGKTLVLENEIDGNPVVEIAKDAFKATGVKNVVVPSNITTVGAQAFMDNYGMESIMFFADTVYLYGNSAEGDNRYVFYGCSEFGEEGNDRTTKLNIYYNKIEGKEDNESNKEGNPNWSIFRQFKEGLLSSTKQRFVGGNDGGARYGAGTWAIVEFNVSGDYAESITGLENGLTFKDNTKLQQNIFDQLNAITVEEGYLNAYKVEVIGELTLNCKYNKIDINIINVPAYYLVEVDAEGCTVSCEDTLNVGGKVYAREGSIVTVTPPDGYEFTSISQGTADGNGGYTLKVEQSKISLKVKIAKISITQVTLYSAVDWNLGSANQAVTISDVTEGETTLPEATATGYYFLGWACNIGNGQLKITSSTVQYSTYYAIWGKTRDEITYKERLAENTTTVSEVPAEHDSTKAAGIEGWYTSDTFKEKFTSLTTSTTVLFARMNFHLVFNIDGGSGSSTQYNVSGQKNESVAQEDYSLPLTFTEGETVNVKLEEQSGKYITSTYHWNQLVVNGGNAAIVNGYKKGNNNNKNRRTFVINQISYANGTVENVNYTTGADFDIQISGNVNVSVSIP